MERRRLLIGAGAVGAAGVLTGLGWLGVTAIDSASRPLALIYRGKAACVGCSGAVAKLLRSSPTRFRTEYCGPEEERQVSPGTLAEAAVYVQPGGGDVDVAWRTLRSSARDIRDFVRGGGHYLGFCLGAYLAGSTPGFGLLPGDTDRYIDTPGARVRGPKETVIRVRWRGQARTMYFQDGPTFKLKPGAAAIVLATYDTGAPAAVVAAYGSGRVGVVGPHPEADQSWYASAGLANPDGIRFDLGNDLIESTMGGSAPAGQDPNAILFRRRAPG